MHPRKPQFNGRPLPYAAICSYHLLITACFSPQKHCGMWFRMQSFAVEEDEDILAGSGFNLDLEPPTESDEAGSRKRRKGKMVLSIPAEPSDFQRVRLVSKAVLIPPSRSSSHDYKEVSSDTGAEGGPSNSSTTDGTGWSMALSGSSKWLTLGEQALVFDRIRNKP